MTDNTELNSDEKSTDIVVENTNNVWKLITPKLLSAVNITAFLTVAGFFVIHSYIQSFSDFYTYNIAVSQYLVAGINMILGTLGFFIPLFFSSIPAMFIGVVLGFVLIVIIYFSPLKKWRVQINKVLQISQVVSFGFLLVMVAFVGFAYGTTLYAHSPRMFGGGMPAQVVLVFQEEQDIQNPLWSFPIDPSNPKKSLPVQILIELTDGIIVRESPDTSSVIVKNNVLQGIIDVPNPISGTQMTSSPSLATPTP